MKYWTNGDGDAEIGAWDTATPDAVIWGELVTQCGDEASRARILAGEIVEGIWVGGHSTPDPTPIDVMMMRDGRLIYAEDGRPVTRLAVAAMRDGWWQADGLGLGYEHPDGLRFTSLAAAKAAVEAGGHMWVEEEGAAPVGYQVHEIAGGDWASCLTDVGQDVMDAADYVVASRRAQGLGRGAYRVSVAGADVGIVE